MISKHAYLIIAHKNPEQLRKLLKLLDDYRNDIFILMDKKSKFFDENAYIEKVCKESKIVFLDRMNICWGGYSQVKAEILLLESAIKFGGGYTYYHLISGQDLPLHSQDYIHSLFKKYDGYEFLTFVGDSIYKRNRPIERVSYYYPAMDIPTNNQTIKKYLRSFQNRILIPLQKFIHINRLRGSDLEIGYGSNWFSITNQFAKYIVENKFLIQKYFSSGYCVDELFIHTLVLNSQFKDKVFIIDGINDKKEDRQGNLRYINWWAGNPKVWRIEDKEELLEAKTRGYVFSRKFDEEVDKEIVDYIVSIVNRDDDNISISL